MPTPLSLSVTKAAAVPEGCPAPLSAPDVLAAFHRESVAWSAERNGLRVAGRSWGDGPPLYFLNPLGVSHELYALLAWLLRQEFRCVLFDYAREANGRGRPRPRTPNGLAEDLFAAADRQGDERFRVFAASFGSLPALTAMQAQPHRIASAVLQGGFARCKLAAFERGMVRLGRFLPGTLRRVPGWEALQRRHRAWFPPFDGGRWRMYLDNAGGSPVACVAAQAAALSRFDLRGGLRDVAQPVLLLRPEGEGRLAARAAEELEAGLPRARSEPLANCGPLAFLTHPHRLAKLIRDFQSPASLSDRSQP